MLPDISWLLQGLALELVFLGLTVGMEWVEEGDIHELTIESLQ